MSDRASDILDVAQAVRATIYRNDITYERIGGLFTSFVFAETGKIETLKRLEHERKDTNYRTPPVIEEGTLADVEENLMRLVAIADAAPKTNYTHGMFSDAFIDVLWYNKPWEEIADGREELFSMADSMMKERLK